MDIASPDMDLLHFYCTLVSVCSIWICTYWTHDLQTYSDLEPSLQIGFSFITGFLVPMVFRAWAVGIPALWPGYYLQELWLDQFMLSSVPEVIASLIAWQQCHPEVKAHRLRTLALMLWAPALCAGLSSAAVGTSPVCRALLRSCARECPESCLPEGLSVHTHPHLILQALESILLSIRNPGMSPRHSLSDSHLQGFSALFFVVFLK